MSITRRRFLLGTTAGLIVPSFYERAYSFFENHGEPLLIVPKRAEGTLYACADFAQPPQLQLHLGHPEQGPPDMTIRDFCLQYGDGEPESWWRDQWLCPDHPDPIDMDGPMDPWTVFDWWGRRDSPTAHAYRYLERLDLGSDFKGPIPVGGLDFIDGACPGNDYLGVEAATITSPYESISCAAKRQKCPHRYPQITSPCFVARFRQILTLFRGRQLDVLRLGSINNALAGPFSIRLLASLSRRCLLS